MKLFGHVAGAGRPIGEIVTSRRAACVLMVLASAGLVVAAFLGAPLVSVLLAGLLLLCPLLMWVPYRFDRDAMGSARRRPGEER